jgi:hypothetical protein
MDPTSRAPAPSQLPRSPAPAAPLLLLLLLAPAAARAEEEPKPADLLKRASVIEQKTIRLRGLRPKRPIAKGVLTRAEILKRVEEKLSKSYAEEEIRAEGAVWKRLGLMKPGTDYRAAMLDLLADQVAGFYDPIERKLNLASWIPMAMQEPALAHEICHALQDQTFDLRRFVEPIRENSDRQLARSALVEGDCSGVMLEYLLAPTGRDLSSFGSALLDQARTLLTATASDKFKAAPLVLRESLLFPYIQGLSLILKIRARHPWSQVNALFKKPPESTEQILHPEKYTQGERPVRIVARPLASARAGYARLRQDVLGEFLLSIVLRGGVSEEIANRSAEGWGGDLLQAYVKRGVDGVGGAEGDGGGGGAAARRRGARGARAPKGFAEAKLAKDVPEKNILLVHLSAWDSEADAVEYANAARRLLAANGTGRTARESASGPAIWVYGDRDGNEWSVRLVEDRVLTIAGSPPSMREAIEREVLDKWTVAGRRVGATK